MTRPSSSFAICMVLVAIIGLATQSPLQAQGDSGKQIQEAFNKGDFEGAAAAAEKYISEFDGMADTGSAMYFSGVAHLLIKKPHIAIFRLEQSIAYEQTTVEIKELALYDLGRAYAAYADALNADLIKQDQDFRIKDNARILADKTTRENPFLNLVFFAPDFKGNPPKTPAPATPAQIAALKELSVKRAIETYDKLLATYPNTFFKPDVMQNKAIIYIQRNNYDQAEKEFETLVAMPGNESMHDDVSFLLGWLYGQRAEKFQQDYQPEKAAEYIAKARTIYEQLAKSDNLATANDSIFQLANLDFTAGNYEQAIHRFRSVMRKTDVLEAQKVRVSNVQARLRGAKPDESRILRRDLQREQDKQAKIEGASDLSLDALVRVGDSYLQNRQPDESRIVYRRAELFAEGEQKKRISVQVIISYAIQGATDAATKSFDEFRQKYPNDMMAQSINYYIGRALMGQAVKGGDVDKEKVQQAIDRFQQNLTEFPKSPVTPEIPKLIGQAYQMLGQVDKAVETYKKFLEDAVKNKLPPDAIEDAKRLMAIALFGLGKQDDGIQMMDELRKNATVDSIKEDAYYRYTTFLLAVKKYDEAAKAIQEYVEKFPTSANAPKAYYNRAKVLYSLAKTGAPTPEKFEAAAQGFRDVYTKYPDDSVASLAYDAVWKVYRDAKNTPKMTEAQDIFLQKFPVAPETVEILLSRAKDLMNPPDDQKPADETARQALEEKAIEAYGKALDIYKQAAKGADASSITPQLREVTASAEIAIGDIYARRAVAMGSFTSLDETKLKEWDGHVAKALEAYAEAIRIAPASNASSQALLKITGILKDRIAYNRSDMEAGLKFFNDLTIEPGLISNKTAKAQILIASSALPYDLGNKKRAADILLDVFEHITADVPVNWQDLDRYGSILLELEKYPEAEKIYTRMKDEFGTVTKQGKTSPNLYVMAAYTYAMGVVKAKTGHPDEATAFFDTLEKEYKWSPKLAEALLFKADALYQNKKVEEALHQFVVVSELQNASPQIRARSMFRLGEILLEQGDSWSGDILKDAKGNVMLGPDKKPITATRMAYNYFNKIDLFYGDAIPELTAQALIKASEIALKWGDKEAAKKHLTKVITRYSKTSSLGRARELSDSLK